MSEYSKVFGNGGQPPPSLERRVSVLEGKADELEDALAHHEARFEKLDQLIPFLIGRIDQSIDSTRALEKRLDTYFTELNKRLEHLGNGVLDNHEKWRRSMESLQEQQIQVQLTRQDVEHVKSRISDARELNETTARWQRDQLMSITEETKELTKIPRNMALDITKGLVVAFGAALLTYALNR